MASQESFGGRMRLERPPYHHYLILVQLMVIFDAPADPFVPMIYGLYSALEQVYNDYTLPFASNV